MFSKKQTVADQLVEVLVQAGVTHVFGLVGDSLNSFSDAVRRKSGGDRANGGLDWVHVHNEEAAAFAASCARRSSPASSPSARQAAVPATPHLIQGVFDAHRSGAPVLVLASAHPGTAQIGTGFFQETHPERLFDQASHYCEMVILSGADATARAHRHPARGRPTAARPCSSCRATSLVLRPRHETGTSAPAARLSPSTPPDARARRARGQAQRRQDRHHLRRHRVCADARDEVLQPRRGAQGADRAQRFSGKESLQWDNPYDVGMSGLLGYGGCFDACHEADVLLLLGTDFPYVDFLPQKNTIQVDIDPSRLGRRTPLELGVCRRHQGHHRGAAAEAGCQAGQGFSRQDARRDGRRSSSTWSTAIPTMSSTSTPIHPEYVARVLDEEAAADADLHGRHRHVLLVDRSLHHAERPAPSTDRLLGARHDGQRTATWLSVPSSPIPARQVVSMSGDGGLAMLLGELLTAKTAPACRSRWSSSTTPASAWSGSRCSSPATLRSRPTTTRSTSPRSPKAAGLPRRTGREARRRPLSPMRAVLDHDGPALLDVVTDAERPGAAAAHHRRGGEGLRAVDRQAPCWAAGVGGMLELARTNLRNIPRP